MFSSSDNGISENSLADSKEIAGSTVITIVSLSLDPTRFWTLSITPYWDSVLTVGRSSSRNLFLVMIFFMLTLSLGSRPSSSDSV